MTTRPNVYEIITDRITALLDKGIIPWRKPWHPDDMPTSFDTGKPYRGINIWMLRGTQLAAGYTSNYWITYKKAQERGAQVRKGEHGTPVVYWHWIETDDDKFPVLKYYTVFNVEQCENLDYPKPEPRNHEPDIEAAQEIYNHMPNKPQVKIGGDRAYYSPTLDYIGMPPAETFDHMPEYYSVLFHEMTHSTGHASRLGRFDTRTHHNFGDQDYSKEELVAELGAAYLCATVGIEQDTLTNSTAYIQSWLGALENDKRMIVYAAAQAQKAADYILNVKHDDQPTTNL